MEPFLFEFSPSLGSSVPLVGCAGLGFSVLCVVAYLFLWRTTKARKALRVELCPGRQLRGNALEAMFQLFSKYFANEHESLQQFELFVHHYDRDVLQFWEGDSLQGFIILKNFETEVETKLRVVMGEFFVVEPRHRKCSTPILALLQYCLMQKLRQPLTRVSYFFVAYSHTAYLSFGSCIPNYYPRNGVKTPAWQQKTLDHLANMEAENWGLDMCHYHPDRGVIEDTSGGKRGRPLLSKEDVTPSPTIGTARAQALNFFLQRNPGYLNGDCLCVLCDINAGNFLLGCANALCRLLPRWMTSMDTTSSKTFSKLLPM